MPTPAKLELTLKITTLPADMKENKHGWKGFTLEAEGRKIDVLLRPRMWQKLVDASTNYKHWVAAIVGGMGPGSKDGFVLTEPAVQVFDRTQAVEEAERRKRSEEGGPPQEG